MRLNLASGGVPLKKYGYIDVDITEEWGDAIDIVADVRNIWMFDDESCSEVFAKDILEHMTRAEWKPALDEWTRVLRPGGLLKLRYPNLELYWKSYANRTSFPSGYSKNKDAYTEKQLKTFAWEKAMQSFYGLQDFPANNHLCGLNFWIVRDYLEEIGMKVITEPGFTDGHEQRITASKGKPDPEISLSHPDYIARDAGDIQLPWPKVK